MKKVFLVAALVIAVAIVIILLVTWLRTPRVDKVVTVIYESAHGYRVVMTAEDDGWRFSYYPSRNREAIERLGGEQFYETVKKVLRETGLCRTWSFWGNGSGDGLDRLTVIDSLGRTRVLERPSDDGAFRSICGCMSEFAGLVK